MNKTTMPDVIVRDTHQFIKRLVTAGMDEKQAEALTEALNAEIQDRLATKHDLELLKRDLKLWFGSMLAFAVTILGILIKVL